MGWMRTEEQAPIYERTEKDIQQIHPHALPFFPGLFWSPQALGWVETPVTEA